MHPAFCLPFRRCVALLGLLLASPWGQAGPGLQSLRFEQIGQDETGVQAIMQSAQQDARGLMWLGTSQGLLRYDGRRGRLFGSDPSDPSTLSHQAVRAMLLLPDERLLLGTERGLDEMDLRSERIRRHGLPGERHMRERYVISLAPAAPGQVWVHTSINLQIFDTAQRRFSEVPLPPLQPLLPGRKALLSAMASDGHGGVWVAAGRELLHLDAQLQLRQRWPVGSFGKAEPGVRTLLLDREGRLWVGTNGGVQVIDAQTGAPQDLPQRVGLPDALVHALCSDAEGAVWVGTGSAGVWRLQPGAARAEQFAHHDALAESLASDAVSALFQDRSGALWVGTWGQVISVVDLRSAGFRKYRRVVGDPDTLATNSVMAVQPEGTEHLWVASYGAGLNRLHLPSGSAERIPLNALPMAYQKALLLQPGRGLWVGGDAGLYLMELPGRRVRRIELGETVGGGLSISSMALDGQGDLWVGSAAGVYRIQPSGELRRFRREAKAPGSLSNEVIDCLLADAAGRLWVGSKGGLQRWDAQRQGFEQPVQANADMPKPGELAIYSLRQDGQGRIWVGSQQGLYELVQAPDASWQLRSWRGLPGMPSGWVHGLENAGDGALWFATSQGLVRLDPARRQLRLYPAQGGRFSGSFVQGGSAAGPDGSLFYGGDGVLQFQPAALQDNPVAPALVLADIRIFNRSLADVAAPAAAPGEAASGLGDLGIQGPLAQASALQLTHREAMVSFDLRALHYVSPRQIRYAWQLEGFDPDWIQGPPGEGLATYTNLDPGRYRLLAKAANPDGVWSEPRRLLEIEVLPPWWRSSWFRALSVLGAGLVLATAWHWRLRRLKQVQQDLETQVERRTAQVRAQRQQIATVSEIGRELTASLDLAAIQQALYKHVAALMPATVFGVGLLRTAQSVIDFDFVIDAGRRFKPYRRSLAAAEQPATRCLQTGEALLLSGIEHDNRQLDAAVRASEGGEMLELEDGGEPTRARSGLYVPLRLKGELIGVISVLSEQPDAYRQTDLDLLQALAAYAAVALDNANAYAQLKFTQAKLFEQEKLASLGSLVAGVAHELNTPLGNSLLAASTLQDGTRQFHAQATTGNLRRSDLQSYCETTEATAGLLVRSLAHAAELVSSFKQLAVDQTSERRRRFDLRKVCEEVHLSLINRLRRDGHHLQLDLPEGLLLDSFPGPLGQVLNNLVLNAVIHGFDGRQGGVMLIHAEAYGAEQLRLRFVDNGAGIPPEHLSRVFDPFFTTKLGSGGSGLGLHLCYTIVRSVLGGDIRVSSTLGQGACFELLLPRVAPQAASAAGAPAQG